MTCGDLFQIPVSKFQELRYNVALILKEMNDLEKKNILKIQDWPIACKAISSSWESAWIRNVCNQQNITWQTLFYS